MIFDQIQEHNYKDFYELIKQIEKDDSMLENMKNNLNQIYSGIKFASNLLLPINITTLQNEIYLIKSLYNKYLKKN